MGLEQRILELLMPSLHRMGYDVVRLQFTEGKRRHVLQVMIERLDGKAITLEDCEAVSHHVSALLDVEDPILSEYNLEISSPGIDRPLTRPKDFERYSGHDAKITTKLPIEGRKRFRGILRGLQEGCVLLDLPEEKLEIRIALENVATAKLVLTDALIEAESNANRG